MPHLSRLTVLLFALFGFALAAPVASGVAGSNFAISAAHADDDDDDDGARPNRRRYTPSWQQRRAAASRGYSRGVSRDDDDDDDGASRNRNRAKSNRANDDDD